MLTPTLLGSTWRCFRGKNLVNVCLWPTTPILGNYPTFNLQRMKTSVLNRENVIHPDTKLHYEANRDPLESAISCRVQCSCFNYVILFDTRGHGLGTSLVSSWGQRRLPLHAVGAHRLFQHRSASFRNHIHFCSSLQTRWGRGSVTPPSLNNEF